MIELPTASRSRLAGYADRLELDADGRVVVVDLKTDQGQAQRPARSAANVQLGLYQLRRRPRCRRRTVDLVPDHGGAPGGAELVQLGLPDGDPRGGAGSSRAQADDGPERAALRDRSWSGRRCWLRGEELPGGRR